MKIHLEMKILAFLSLVIICTLSCTNQSVQDCKGFKTGHFTIHAELNNTTYSIQRDKYKQMEIDPKTGNKSEWAIYWLNDCEYKLQLIKDNFGLLSSRKKMNLMTEFTYKIITTTNDYYIFQTKFGPSLPLVTDTIFKSD